MPKPKSIDSDIVRELAELLDESGLTEIEYDTGQLRVRVARQQTVTATAAPAASAAPAAPRAAEAAPVLRDASHPGALVSPMVGTVYLAPEPGAPNFVSKGDSVVAGQTLMLVEAMKTFNEIKTTRGGIVTEILIENGAPVEYGEVLAIIE